MRLVKFVFVSVICLLPFTVQALDHTKPQMLKDKYYKEFWEQHFLFDDGTFVSSQFTVANFPWPVGKEHGIMVATLVRPDGKRTIIKNGRDLGKWNFDSQKFDLFIHTHRIKRVGDKIDFHIGKVDHNDVDVTGKMNVPAIDHARIENKKGFMESSFYLPYFAGEGSWKIQLNKKQPFVSGAGGVQGFGTHVLFTGPVGTLLKNWLRVSGLRQQDNDQPTPFLSVIEKLDGSHDIVLTLKDAAGKLTRFSEVNIEYQDIKKLKKKVSYPTVIKLKANKGEENLTGTIRFTRKIDHFNINDHLNFFERSFAKSRASVTNFRYIAEYDLSYVTASGSQKITGKALSEYQDIQPPKKKKKSRKKRRR